MTNIVNDEDGYYRSSHSMTDTICKP